MRFRGLFQKKTELASNKLILKEFGDIVLSRLALMLILSFISYTQEDYAFGPDQEIHNWLGPLGAKVAKVLLGSMGLLAITVPLYALLFVARWLFDDAHFLSPSRFFGFLLGIFGFAPLFSYFWPPLGGVLVVLRPLI